MFDWNNTILSRDVKMKFVEYWKNITNGLWLSLIFVFNFWMAIVAMYTMTSEGNTKDFLLIFSLIWFLLGSAISMFVFTVWAIDEL